MRNRRNYYRILHVQPDAPSEIIRSSYRALMLQLEMHPDRGGEHWKAALINEAYAMLSDAARRAEYDRQLSPSTTRRSTSSDGGDLGPTDDTTCVFCGAPCAVEATERPTGRCAACASPLYPADRFVCATSRQRAASRLRQQRELRLFTDWPQRDPQRAMARDISPRGLRLRCRSPLRPFEIVKIDGGPIQATGRVVHCTPDRDEPGAWSVGIEFFTLRVEAGAFVSCSV